MSQIEREQFEKWLENRNSYDAPDIWSCWQAAYHAGAEAQRERDSQYLEACAKRWLTSLPIDEVQALNAKQYAKALRSAPIEGEK